MIDDQLISSILLLATCFLTVLPTSSIPLHILYSAYGNPVSYFLWALALVALNVYASTIAGVSLLAFVGVGILHHRKSLVGYKRKRVP